MSIRTLIVDDEPLARDNLAWFCDREPDLAPVTLCANGYEALDRLRADAVDLMFLDVQMPRLSGFEVLGQLEQARRPLVVFTTAFDQYAIRAFEVNAVDYLLKPIEEAGFRRATERARTRLASRAVAEYDRNVQRVLAEMRTPKPTEPVAEAEDADATSPGYARRFMVKSAGELVYVDVDDIDWLETAGNYVERHVGPRTHLLRETMNNMERRLDPKQFVRVHRRIILNARRVVSFKPCFRGEFLARLDGGAELKMSRRYRAGWKWLLNEA